MSQFIKKLSLRLQQRREQGLYRQRSINACAAQISSHKTVDFASNNYLGMANHPLLIECWKKGLDSYGAGSTGASLVTGYTAAHAELEETIAGFTGRDKAVVLGSGYTANLSVLSALLNRHDLLVADKWIHASLLDGIQLSHARCRRYTHAEPDKAESLLIGDCKGSKYLLTEGVFSMDGDIAALPSLVSLCNRQEATLILDDAHGLGMLGHSGGGACEHFGLNAAQVPVLTGGFGKAFGVAGGFIAGSAELIETVIQFARPYIYSTAMPPAQALVLTQAIKLIEQASDRRQRLNHNIDLFRALAKERQLPVIDSLTAIQPVLLQEIDKTMQISVQMQQAGYQIVAIRPPTVPVNSARIRITLSSEHTESQINGLIDCLANAIGNWHHST